MNRIVVSLVGIALTVAVAGCGASGPVKAAVIKVPGKLLVDDKPFGPATLTLSPPEFDKDKPSATGNVDKEGKISFVTYGEEGIAPGSYVITMAGDIMTMSSVPACEPAKVDIKSGDTTIEIKLKSIPGKTVGGLAMPHNPDNPGTTP